MGGLQVGEDLTSFTPYHVFGPDIGSKTCPICKYGRFQGILYFVGNNPDCDAILEWLSYFEFLAEQQTPYLKVYFVYGNENESFEKQKSFMKDIGTRLQLKHTALTIVPSLKDTISNIHKLQLDPTNKNTIFLYKRSNITAIYHDLPPSTESFKMIKKQLEDSFSPLFQLQITDH